MFFNFQKYLKLDNKGFTLIEVLVAMTLFVILITIASASFVSALRTQRAIVSLMGVNDNVSLALEQMSRAIRTGTNFQDTHQTGDISHGIQFTDTTGRLVHYYWDSSEHSIRVLYGPSGGPPALKVTADNVNVKGFTVLICGTGFDRGNFCSSPSDRTAGPPRITINLSISPTDSYFNNYSENIQTTISARNF